MQTNQQVRFCAQCGTKISANAAFCNFCGAKQAVPQQPQPQQPQYQAPPQNPVPPQYQASPQYQAQPQYQTQPQQPNPQPAEPVDIIGAVIKKASALTGENADTDLKLQDLKLKDLVCDVTRKHTKDERDEIFSCGTAKTTPKESEISAEWPKPWLYSRVFLMFAATFALLVLMADQFQNGLAYPALMFVGALTVPFAGLIFFFEVNAPRNTSIYEVLKVFFIGGALSLVASLILFEIYPVRKLDYGGAIAVGIIEEIGKLVVVAIFCREAKTKHILTGMLIGAAVGAGFAVIETAGYIFDGLFAAAWDGMMETLYVRAFLALGGHIVWAAISGAAIIICKGDQPLKSEHIFNARFLKLFLVPVVLHAIWDMPIELGDDIYLVQILLTLAAWVMVLVLLNTGLKQISRLSAAAKAAEEKAAAAPAE